MKRAAIALLVCVAAGCAMLSREAQKAVPEPPSCVCRTTVDRITIDGVLAERSWQLAAPIPFILRDGVGTPTRPTTARMCWDKTNLYVAFECSDPDIWATLKNHDDPLWTEEVVEIFIDPNGTGEPYFEIEINPLNVVVDLRFPGPAYQGFGLRGKLWDAGGMQTAVKVTGTITSDRPGADPNGRWTVEAALPFSALDGAPNLPPKDGDVWRANLYRIERPPQLGNEDDEYSAWAPLYDAKSYHTRERFGKLVFSTKPLDQK